MTPAQIATLRQLPAELRNLRQWCIAGPDRAPYAVHNGTVAHASLHRVDQWKTFEEALADASAVGNGSGVGFMLTTEDPFTCIDLDVKNEKTQINKGEPIDPAKWTTQEEINRYTKIIETFDSYSEVSSGGFGIHIWVRGFIGAGARRQGVEVYSQERFIVCTGNVFRHKPIEQRQDLLEMLVDDIRRQGSDIRTNLEEIEPEDSDMEVYERASSAENAAKFNALCEGRWRDLGFPSQSEADLALMSMFAFYSKSNEQCRQLFRCTTLGQRDKAQKNDRYLNYTLEVIRGRQKREELASESTRQLAAEFVREITGGSTEADVNAGRLAVSQGELPEVESTISWPPGIAGQIASFIYQSSPRPVKEVSIVAALGLLAGICGKAYYIHQSGLNAYIILVARSGVGKEAMHSGLSLIINELQNSIPAASKFVDFTDFASGPALKKACAMNQSFVNVAGEWGRKLKRLSEDKADGPMATLRTAMTDLYQKSGPQSLVGGVTYSDKEKNVGSVSGVAFSMIGETTPTTFYEALTQTMMEDGFLSRFTIIDYNGERPPLNQSPVTKMHPGLAQALHGLCAQALTLISRFANQLVMYSPDAGRMLQTFDKECDFEINESTDESKRQMWNRAHLKVCRIAALLAVADNWLTPVVTKEHAHWALELIRRDISIMRKKIVSGDIGVDDQARERKMAAVIKEYFTSSKVPDAYKAPETLRHAYIIPKRFLTMRLCQVGIFRGYRNGSTAAIDVTVKGLIENGYLVEMDRTKMLEEHKYHGRCYRVIGLPEY
jgi:hypothetical protein